MVTDKSIDYHGIDIMKFVMSFAVIAIHAPEYLYPEDRTYPFFIDWFIRLAVPYFFICTGFLIQQRIEGLPTWQQKGHLKSRAIKLFRIWCVWLLIYLPLTVYGLWHTTGSFYDKAVLYLESVILTGHTLYAQPLWFIYSMAIILLIWSLWVKKASRFRLWELFMLFTAITLIGWIMPNFWGIYSTHIHSITIWIMGGGMPICAGALVCSYNPSRNICFLTALSCVISSLILYKFNYPFWPFLGGMAVFLIAVQINIANKFDYNALRKESMWIYYIHMYIIFIFMVAIRQLHISVSGMLLLLCVCIITFGCSRMLIWLNKHQGFRHLEKLIR